MRYLKVLATAALLSAFAWSKDPIAIYLAGDSTMATKLAEKRPETGWGEYLQQFFDQDDVRIENYARGGRSTRTFLEEGRWQRIMNRIQPGDYVFIQFGHNDAAKDKPERYTSHEDYRRNLIRFVTEARTKKANPVLLTPVMRRRFDKDGNFQDAHGEYPVIMREVAVQHKVPLIDMHRKSEAVIKRYGVEDSRKLFLQLKPNEHPNYPQGIDDNTHFSPLGAQIMATLAAEGIPESGLELAKHLREPGRTRAAAAR